MGFDPRRWSGSRGGAARVTVGADRRWMERQRWAGEGGGSDDRAAEAVDTPTPDTRSRRSPWQPRARVTVGAAPGITPDTVRRWGEAMAAHPRWGALQLEALAALAGRCHARGLDPSLPLEEALDRHTPGLGRELRWALGGPRSRARLAVRAAFALHGPRAADQLDRRPLEVVEELLAACGAAASQGRGDGGRRQRRTSSDDRPGGGGQARLDPRRREALTLLGLEPDAGRDAVKAAHRRLVKRHHPDVGGDAEMFRRVDAAYRLLIA